MLTLGLPLQGRLDFKSEGLLLLTTDGDVARYLELPTSQLERTYQVRAHGRNVGAVLHGPARVPRVDDSAYGGVLRAW